jgi:UDP-N-acetylmuramoylalanine--D-glutamate ligase
MAKRIVILGGGESGTGAAVLAKKNGFDVFVSDSGEIKEKYLDLLSKYRIPLEQKNHSADLILNADEVIKSPGIPLDAPIIKQIAEKQIPIIDEIEFAGRYNHAKTICITGSNGKTTTTLLTYHILKNAGFNVGLAGNVGKSFALQVAEDNFDWFVIELSSFQLDCMFQFKADIAVLLNITPDHLNRYEYKFQNYIDSKFRIIQNLTENDSFIYCLDDEVTANELKTKKIPAKKYPFSVNEKPEEGGFLTDNILHIKLANNDFTMNTEDLSIQGIHNVYNSMASGIASKLADIRDEKLRESFQSFKGVEHRLEKFLKIKGVEYINDSKATNINSAWYALQSMKTPVIWIVGGIDKGNDYGMLRDLVRKKVKAIITLGLENSRIHEEFIGMVPIYDTQLMDLAVQTAYRLAEEGDTVLLSPACASFDLFKNYEDRGQKFKESVSLL